MYGNDEEWERWENNYEWDTFWKGPEEMEAAGRNHMTSLRMTDVTNQDQNNHLSVPASITVYNQDNMSHQTGSSTAWEGSNAGIQHNITESEEIEVNTLFRKHCIEAESLTTFSRNFSRTPCLLHSRQI